MSLRGVVAPYVDPYHRTAPGPIRDILVGHTYNGSYHVNITLGGLSIGTRCSLMIALLLSGKRCPHTSVRIFGEPQCFTSPVNSVNDIPTAVTCDPTGMPQRCCVEINARRSTLPVLARSQ